MSWSGHKGDPGPAGDTGLTGCDKRKRNCAGPTGPNIPKGCENCKGNMYVKIAIKKSPTADTRTCDWSKVDKETLRNSSWQHIDDVYEAMSYFEDLLATAAEQHDADKLSDIDNFHDDFTTGFKSTTWWDRHRKINRHHLNAEDGIPEDVNLLDVLEHVADCVTAGAARQGSVDGVYAVKLPDVLLQKALLNTVELLKQQLIVVD
jgi:hypothetical protein